MGDCSKNEFRTVKQKLVSRVDFNPFNAGLKMQLSLALLAQKNRKSENFYFCIVVRHNIISKGYKVT